MSKMLRKAARKNTGWATTGDQSLYGSRRLGADLKGAFEGVSRLFGLVFGRGAGGISGRMLTLGELVRDLSGTRLGRVATSGVGLFAAWILLT